MHMVKLKEDGEFKDEVQRLLWQFQGRSANFH